MIHKNQEIDHNINMKVKFETYFQLKFIFIMYSYGYTTWSWRYIMFIMFFFQKILDTNIHTKKFNYYLKLKRLYYYRKNYYFRQLRTTKVHAIKDL